MSLTEEQKQHYQSILTLEREQIERLDQQIEEELAKVKDRLAELQQEKKRARQMYDATCVRLGVPNDLEEQDEDDSSDI
jgi:hypothetical protein